MLSVTVHVTGLDKAQMRLTKLSASFKDFSGALASLGAQLMMFYGQTVIGNEGDPLLGHRWPELKQTTENEKNKKWPGRGMEVRSGAMQQDFYDMVTPVSLFVGNRAPYFAYQQLGTGYKGFGGKGVGRGHNLPARQMIGVNETVESMIKVAIEADVRAKISASKI